eukprot:2318-Eustigmatos_ZCMA.PRE.1
MACSVSTGDQGREQDPASRACARVKRVCVRVVRPLSSATPVCFTRMNTSMGVGVRWIVDC